MTAPNQMRRLTGQAGPAAARNYHAPRWNEPLIFALDTPGGRGVIPPPAPPELRQRLAGTPIAAARRTTPVDLPRVNQPQVLRHFLRLSQETLGADLNVDIGQGTCTMKYSPKVHEAFVAEPGLAQAHPWQEAETVQGLLRIIAELESYLAEITGMGAVCLQPGAGSMAIYTNVKIVAAYHQARGDQPRDEVITTIFSHPTNAAAARTAGYRVVTLQPGPEGFVPLSAFQQVLSSRTAAILVTNPEDTGVFNPQMKQIVQAAHQVGALTVYDQANANGLLGIARAGDAGFDLGQLNLHKTFSTPHGGGGPATGAILASRALAEFLPGPRVVLEADGRYRWAEQGPWAVAPVHPAHGVMGNLVRAYAWIRALGPEGLRQVAETAVLNNNYIMTRLTEIDGVEPSYVGPRLRPIEQVRYSWQGLTEATGITSGELGQRMADYGFHYWTSHHPYVVPQPATIEPTESYTKAELDEYVAALKLTAREAHANPRSVRGAPHRSSIHQVDPEAMSDPDTWATSWRAYRRKYLGQGEPVPPHWQPGPDTPAKPRPPKAF
ncbi:MAG: aminomethyl-transferring glycine dehydrogenase subunit GcvPB, partial [Bifidobacteriaceae bacterium]|nr:aminomethyl-transferring glycine dehydrogenase subunit GcvPB [Bifidobacteriaceae bacterium]